MGVAIVSGFKGGSLERVQADGGEDEIHTPPALARQLLAAVDGIEEGASFLDPFKGFGAFLNAWLDAGGDPASADFAEINEGRDFFKWPLDERRDWVISNPPFSRLNDIIKHTSDIAEVGFAYILPLYALTPLRQMLADDAGWRISQMIFFKNPTEWRLGFPMALIVWGRKSAPLSSRPFVTIGQNKAQQTKLIMGGDLQ